MAAAMKVQLVHSRYFALRCRHNGSREPNCTFSAFVAGVCIRTRGYYSPWITSSLQSIIAFSSQPGG